MKKIILLLIIFFNLLLFINKGKWQIIGISSANASFPVPSGESPGGDEEDPSENQTTISNGGTSEGGNEVNQGGNTTPDASHPVPKFCMNNINMRTTMPSQSKENSCVPTAMSYTDKTLDPTSKTTETDYTDIYKADYGVDPGDEGVPYTNLDEFIKSQFNTIPYTGITTAIDAGYPILIIKPIQVDDGFGGTETKYHEVEIVGYDTIGNTKNDSNMEVYYMDPATGEIEVTTMDEINTGGWQDPEVITGHK